ncbi:translation initiation factor IF-2-like [Suncus etruscus]|uniref:translation initiation factor IF-2-like n=1 Tax=Suncus etruscus TaxID=109475 RepID=UPI00210F6CBA|nr:translation initiation factor IF-2-like [Suncus etruscus]
MGGERGDRQDSEGGFALTLALPASAGQTPEGRGCGQLTPWLQAALSRAPGWPALRPQFPQLLNLPARDSRPPGQAAAPPGSAVPAGPVRPSVRPLRLYPLRSELSVPAGSRASAPLARSHEGGNPPLRSPTPTPAPLPGIRSKKRTGAPGPGVRPPPPPARTDPRLGLPKSPGSRRVGGRTDPPRWPAPSGTRRHLGTFAQLEHTLVFHASPVPIGAPSSWS